MNAVQGLLQSLHTKIADTAPCGMVRHFNATECVSSICGVNDFGEWIIYIYFVQGELIYSGLL